MVVKLTVNNCASGNEQKAFRQPLYNLRHGKTTEEEWNMISKRACHRVKCLSLFQNAVELCYGNEQAANEKIGTARYSNCMHKCCS